MIKQKDDAAIVKELCDIEYGLTDWEVDFVESIAKQVESGVQLTEKQYKKATDILVRIQEL